MIRHLQQSQHTTKTYQQYLFEVDHRQQCLVFPNRWKPGQPPEMTNPLQRIRSDLTQQVQSHNFSRNAWFDVMWHLLYLYSEAPLAFIVALLENETSVIAMNWVRESEKRHMLHWSAIMKMPKDSKNKSHIIQTHTTYSHNITWYEPYALQTQTKPYTVHVYFVFSIWLWLNLKFCKKDSGFWIIFLGILKFQMPCSPDYQLRYYN